MGCALDYWLQTPTGVSYDNVIISPGTAMRQMKGGAAWSALADIKAVHVSVAANSNAIPYSSLRKDAIAHREVCTGMRLQICWQEYF